MTNLLSSISQVVEKGDDKRVIELVGKALDSGITALDILEKGLVPGIQALGQMFKDGQAYLPEILISTRAMKTGTELLQPHLAAGQVKRKGTVVIGTVKGDVHDIGKNLVKIMLESNGYDVHDLGVDVTADAFAREARSVNADVVAASALLTTTMVLIPDIFKALAEAGLKTKVRLMIGGAPITRQFADEVGAEGFASDCASAVTEADRLMKLSV